MRFLALSKIKKNALMQQRYADITIIHRNVTLLRAIPENYFARLFPAAASSQVSNFFLHRAIPGIKFSHLVQFTGIS
jgi:hypothetical protein